MMGTVTREYIESRMDKCLECGALAIARGARQCHRCFSVSDDLNRKEW